MHLTILSLLLTITSWCNFIAAKPAGGFVKQNRQIYRAKLRLPEEHWGIEAHMNEVRMQTRIAQAPDTNYGGKQWRPRAIKDAVKFNEVELMNKLFTQVVAGKCRILHSIGLGHGDLKQDNILVSGNTPANYVAKIIDFDLAQEIKDLKPPEFSTARNGFNMKLHDAWGLGKYNLIREKLLKRHSLLGISSSSLLTPKPSNSIIKKVLMLVNDANERSTPEAMVQHILEENLRKK
ncbi:hypothetical protein BDF22DRAFT_740861 [Syncephalis plumigaleata]|nr:hypothetical protein BDF22DRAFT_740861 [Syncephalis plumigaleata]